MRLEAVSDSIPLIGLAQIGRLPLLDLLFGRVLIPPAVRRETSTSVPSVSWVIERQLSAPMPASIRRATLDPGEAEAISLALELQASAVLLDERAARNVAARVGLRVIGTVGILVASKHRNAIPAVRPELDALLSHGFYLGQDIYDTALELAGESST